MNTFNFILNKLYFELKRHENKYTQLHNMFGFFEIIKGLEASEIKIHARELLSLFPEDLEPVVVDECFTF